MLQQEPFSVARRRMVERQLLVRGIKDERVLATMLKVPRHQFVADALAEQAYGDYPLGIGEGQTISQPYIVALMTEALQLRGGEKILEIGTGCGYQTAILAAIVGQVYTIERIKNLGFMARHSLKNLGYKNIVMRIGDGSRGWSEAGPFDGILIAAGSPTIPAPLLEQLADGGRLVIPVGNEDAQDLIRMTRMQNDFKKENLGACRFVKLVGRHGWQRQTKAGDKFVKRSLV